MLLTLKCDRATHLVSDSFERDLTPVERWAVRLHHISCRYCRRLARQLKLIHAAARRTDSSNRGLSPEARKRVAAAIAAAGSQQS